MVSIVPNDHKNVNISTIIFLKGSNCILEFFILTIGYFLESTVIPLISFFVGSCLFKGTYHGLFLFFLFLSLSLFPTSGFANAGASETEVGFLYKVFITKIRGGGG